MYLIFYFFLKILVVFKIVSKVTPVSAKTACHILATPIAPKTNTNTFTPIANIRFCFIIF